MPLPGWLSIRDLCGVSVNHLQALSNIQNANACSGGASRTVCRHADAIVLNFDYQPLARVAAADIDAACVHLRREAMLDGVFHQRLQDHAGNQMFERRRFQFLHHLQVVVAKASNFNVKVIIEKLDLFAQRHERVSFAEQAPQNVAQLDNHFTR